MARKKNEQVHETGAHLARVTPGIHQYRRQLILALCGATSVNTHAYIPDEIGRRIVSVANAIIEESEQ